MTVFPPGSPADRVCANTSTLERMGTSQTKLSSLLKEIVIGSLGFPVVQALSGFSQSKRTLTLHLALAQRLLPVAAQRRQEIAQNGSRSGLDLHRHCHPGRQIDHPVVDPDLRSAQRDARAVVQFLAFRLAGLIYAAQRPVAGAVLRAIADHG